MQEQLIKEMPNLTTPRLLMRDWTESDRPTFAELNADPLVMAHFPALLTPAESDAMIDRIQAKFRVQGFGFWALEHRQTGEFLGFVGLNSVSFTAPFTPAVEIGWRLAQRFWGQGYASEAARAALEFGFKTLQLPEIVSFTAIPNQRSQALMQRLGMTRNAAEDFDHPALPQGHPLQRHVLYRLTKNQWMG